ncbi:ornithine decarboxylase [uncultured Dialister sp.]|uniref:Orn/Lys/Arg family decarboxylase n=1 Tax=uncultured Dialister sp. TaxID=278064 RepID=UPI00260BB345|nr:ornithine decarboxylase [uncultured Dialister sp.]
MKINKLQSLSLPPFTAALLAEAERKRDDFDTPGHHSGRFFNLTEEGKAFTAALGDAMFRADISDSSSAIGDPSSHEGISGEAERLASSVWGSDDCFFVLGGTSTSNRICANALLSKGDLVLFDRNNHKSTWQGALLEAGALPVYLSSCRNDSGVIGPILPKYMEEGHLREEIRKVRPELLEKARPFRLACLQICTYDGLFSNVRQILEKIGHLCEYILFDDAWGGYENFIPLLKDAAVLTFPLSEEAPGILITQSVHKQLAGFSMTSQIHKKDSHIKNKPYYLPYDVMNDTFLMHISTSPYYPLLAGLEMNAFIHKEKGTALWQEAFRAATRLKKAILKETTLFTPFLPPSVHGRKWEAAKTSSIMEDPAFFSLSPDESWHGFDGPSAGASLLDPCKVLLTTGTFSEKRAHSIPAPLLSSYLESRGITPEKSDFYTLLLLAEPGDTKKKYKYLVHCLKEFEKAYFRNIPMGSFMPSIKALPGEGLQDFCRRFHDFLFSHKAGELQQSLFREEDFPPRPLTPFEARQHFIRGKRKKLPLKEAAGHISLEDILPYPPGIVALAAGEEWTENVLSYFLFMEAYGREFPDFMPEIIGVHHDEKGLPYVWVSYPE